MSEYPITAAARVVRSKNAGPFELTLDIIFRAAEDFELNRRLGTFTRERFAALYNMPLEAVGPVIYYEPALAVKVTLKRTIASGTFGDTDVYGAQQHAPMLERLTVALAAKNDLRA
jgi:hypothetical protein